MAKKINKSRKYEKDKLRLWIAKHYLQLALFNIILIVLVLLRSAGYFEPFFPITINVIFVFSLLLSVLLLGTNVRSAIVVAFVFWILAALFRILNINVWAERAAIYSYEALFVATILLLYKSSVFNKIWKR